MRFGYNVKKDSARLSVEKTRGRLGPNTKKPCHTDHPHCLLTRLDPSSQTAVAFVSGRNVGWCVVWCIGDNSCWTDEVEKNKTDCGGPE
jgi:hypothetical protein